MLWLIKIFFAHLLTDFVLQPRGWITDRYQKHFQSKWLYVHGAITAIVALLFTGLEYWPAALIIFITHTMIDGWKSFRPQTIIFFVADQLLHLLVMLGCWYFLILSPKELASTINNIANNSHFWIILTAFLFLSFPAGIMIGQMTQKWSRQLPGSEGLANAGKWIGILERLIILTFLLLNQYGAIGLLITAKGLLRFSDKDKQEAKTEYVLIGTLISVAVALFTGVGVKEFLLKVF